MARNTAKFEGAQHYCVDCGTEIGNGTRCEDCYLSCEHCGDGGFRTKADYKNHMSNGHCANCHEAAGDLQHFVFEETDVVDGNRLTLVNGLEMAGGYLCFDCRGDA